MGGGFNGLQMTMSMSNSGMAAPSQLISNHQMMQQPI
jgi:transcription factor STE12